jgi:GAF domain-containing protein
VGSLLRTENRVQLVASDIEGLVSCASVPHFSPNMNVFKRVKSLPYIAPKEGDRQNRAEKRCAQMTQAILRNQEEGTEHNLTSGLTAICDQLTAHYKVKTAFVSIVTGAKWVQFIAASGMDLELTPGSKPPVSGGLHFGHYCCHRELPIIVLNALDNWRCNQHPLVTGAPNIRFYAGHPITIAHHDGLTFLGTLCIVDDKPRESFLLDECSLLEQLSTDVSSLLMTIPDLRAASISDIRRLSIRSDDPTDDPNLLENQFADLLAPEYCPN